MKLETVVVGKSERPVFRTLAYILQILLYPEDIMAALFSPEGLVNNISLRRPIEAFSLRQHKNYSRRRPKYWELYLFAS